MTESYSPKSVRVLIDTVRWAKANPDVEISVSRPGNFPWLTTGAGVVAWFRDCVSRKTGYASRGRRDTPEHWRNLQWDRDRIAEYGRRIRHFGCTGLLRTPEMKARYPHIDNQPRYDD